MASAPSIGTQLVMRLETPNTPGSFGVLASAIGDAGGMVGAVDTRTVGKTTIIRDVTVERPQRAGRRRRCGARSKRLDGVRILNVSDSTFLAHLGGKIRTGITRPVKTRQDLSTVYTPGVARVSSRDREGSQQGLRAHDQAQHRLRAHRRHRGARPGRHRALRRGAGDGGQVHALQAVRRHRRVPDLPRHQGRRRDRRHRQAHRADLRRHQPRGHQRAALLRGRAAAGRRARHPGDARRSARHGGRHPGRAHERRGGGRQADRGSHHRADRQRRRRDRDDQDAARRRACAT